MATIQTTTGDHFCEPQHESSARLTTKGQVEHIETIAEIAKPLPKFADLPLQKGGPPYSAWGLWGGDDEAGTLVSSLLKETYRLETLD